MQAGNRLLGLWLAAAFSHALGVEALGQYLLAMSIQAVAGAAADLGLNTLTVRDLARDAPGDWADEFLGSVLVLKVVAALLAMLCINLAVAPLFGAGSQTLIRLASLMVLSEAITGSAAALMRARQRMGISSSLALGARLTATILAVVLLRTGSGAERALAGVVMAHALGTVAHLVVLAHWRVCLRWGGFGRARQLLRDSLPFALTGVVAMLYRRADLMVLSSERGDATAGVYGAAYRLWETFGLIPASLLDAWFPELSRRVGDPGMPARLSQLQARTRRILLVLVLVLVGIGLAAANPLVSLLYGDDLAEGWHAVALLRLLLLVLPLTHLYLLDGHLLYALGQQRQVTGAMLGVTAGNIAANLLLIPHWGYWGAASVALLSEIALFAALRLLVARALRSQALPEAF
ncbi:MAG: oligosaccharide flippase family protein [Anaerolineae bacterium]|nr:oligosaccharide flippase family protein [Anaerolineae bacterium]